MKHALSMEDFSRLQANLVVPLIVGDIMIGAEPLDEEARYALHDALSEIDPDSALLAIALSAQHVAARYIGSIPVAVAVKFEAEKMLQEYGPEWLANYYGGPVDEANLFEMLQTLPEDLEGIADLLDAMRASIIHDMAAKDLCEILSIQARAHMEVADYIISELETALHSDGDATADTLVATQMQSHSGANIIPFPQHRTRQ